VNSVDIRQEALRLAMQANPGMSSDAIVAAAKDFEKYLSGGDVLTGAGLLAGAVFGETMKSHKPFLYSDKVERLSDESQKVVRAALTEALQLGHNKIQPEHLVLAIIRDGQSKAAAALFDMAGDGNAARKAVINRLVTS